MQTIYWEWAPEGVTHWEPEELAQPSWMRLEGDEWFYWNSKGDRPGWVRTRVSQQRVAKMIAKPAPEASTWDGESPPPIGEMIEYLGLNESEWRLGKVVGFDCSMPVVRCRCGYVSAYSWRKYLSPEERAAQVREKAIAEMLQFNRKDGGVAARSYCERLYDAGYRKTEGGAQ